VGAPLTLAFLPARSEDEEATRAPYPVEGDAERSTACEQQSGKTAFPPKPNPSPSEIVRTALCLEPRHGALATVFMPPVQRSGFTWALVTSIENTAAACRLPLLVRRRAIRRRRCVHIRAAVTARSWSH